MSTMLKFMRMSTELITINVNSNKNMPTMTRKGTAREKRNTTTNTMTPGTIVEMMGGRTCGNCPSSDTKLICRVDRYIC